MRVHLIIVSCEVTNMGISNVVITKWYLTLIAGCFLILCGISSVRYIAMDISLIDGRVPTATQIPCFAATISAAWYFYRPMVGSVGLMAISFYGLLLSTQAANARGVVFYGIVIALFIISIRDKKCTGHL